MGCKRLDTDFFNFLEETNSKKRVCGEKKRVNYYPFGLQHKGYNNVVSGNANSVGQKFGYNGKELNEELGLNWVDYGWRNYDASLGRWMNIDPLAEKYYSISNYSYTFNNPVRFIDPDGREVIIVFNKDTNTLRILDLDRYDPNRETRVVNSENYKESFEEGEEQYNQVLEIENVFTGGNNIDEESMTIDEAIEYAENENQLAIPSQRYDLLEYDGTGSHSGWYRLDAQDEKPYDDLAQGYENAQGTTRGQFRLHRGNESWGCVTMCIMPNDDRKQEWNLVDRIIKNTSTTSVPDRRGNQEWNPFSYIANYGTVIVTGQNPEGETPKNE